jgi:hypothetical protein
MSKEVKSTPPLEKMLAAVALRPPIHHPTVIPILRDITHSIYNGADHDSVYGTACEDYVVTCLDGLLGTDNILSISPTGHGSYLDKQKIDVVLLYADCNHTFVQVAATARAAKQKRKDMQHIKYQNIFVLPVFDYKEQLIDQMLIRRSILTWHFDHKSAQTLLWSEIEKTKVV